MYLNITVETNHTDVNVDWHAAILDCHRHQLYSENIRLCTAR